MANAAAKKTAAHNEKSLKNLQYGMLLTNVLSILLRWYRSRGIFSLSFGFTSFLLLFSYPLEAFLFWSLSGVGKTVRDATGAVLRAPSVDLANPGYVYEGMFDVLYITWACQVGSALLGEWFWWLYIAIPGYLCFKIGPMIYGFLKPNENAADDVAAEPATSKRQQKLKARQERGDPRVKAVNAKQR